MIRQVKDCSFATPEMGEIIAVDDFLAIIKEELAKYGITFIDTAMLNQEFMYTDDALMVGAELLQSASVTRMKKYGIRGCLANHA